MQWSAHVTPQLRHNGDRHSAFGRDKLLEESGFAAKSGVEWRLPQPSTRAPSSGELE